MSEITKYISKAIANIDLSFEEAARAMQIISFGGATPVQTSSYLTALQMKKITPEELAGSASIINKRILNPKNFQTNIFSSKSFLVNQQQLLNISLAVNSLISNFNYKILDLGLPSPLNNASYEILKSLGYNQNLSIEQYLNCLDETNYCFIPTQLLYRFIPDIHYIKLDLPFKSLFDFVLPFISPLKLDFLIIGCSNSEFHNLFINCAKILGLKKLWLVSNELGIDKFVPGIVNYVTELNDGIISAFEIFITNNHFKLSDLSNNIEHNPQILYSALENKKGSYYDIIVLNAAATLVFLNLIDDIDNAIIYTKKIIEEKLITKNLKKIVGHSNNFLILNPS